MKMQFSGGVEDRLEEVKEEGRESNQEVVVMVRREAAEARTAGQDNVES